MNKKLLTLLGIGVAGFILYEMNTYEKPIPAAMLRIQEDLKTLPANVWEHHNKTALVRNAHGYALALRCGDTHSVQIFHKGQSIMEYINIVFRLFSDNGTELTWFLTTPIKTKGGLANQIDNGGLYFLQSYGRDHFTVRIEREELQTSFSLKNSAKAIANCLQK